MTDLVKTQKNKNLINFKTLKPEDVFKEGGSDPIIEGLQKILDSHVPDVTTDKGRKAVASFSYSFSTSKTFLKAMGDKLTEKHKAIIKPITTERIKLEKACDSMRDQAREALNEWEEEQTRISNEKKARVKLEAAMEESRIEYDSDLISAYYDNEMFDREKKMKDFEAKQVEEEKAAQVEKERIEKERLDKIAEDKKIKEDFRLNKMFELKLNYDGQSFTYKDINFHWTDLVCMTDEEFINAVSGAKIRKEQIDVEEKTKIAEKAKKEADEKAEELKLKQASEKLGLRQERIMNLGFNFNGMEGIYTKDDLIIKCDELNLDDKDFEFIIKNASDNIKAIDAEYAEKQRLADIEIAEKQRLQDIEDANTKAKKEQDEALEKQKREQQIKESKEAHRLETIRLEEEKKAANKNHQASVNRKVLKKLMSINLSEDEAKDIIEDILKNPIPQITINYGR